jgi:hypothetical protein
MGITDRSIINKIIMSPSFSDIGAAEAGASRWYNVIIILLMEYHEGEISWNQS